MCCRLLGIREIQKPMGEWCPHCAIGKGCKIYEERPPSCADYQCIWLQSQATDNPMPLHTRPDKSKVVLTQQEDKVVSAHQDPGYPAAYEQGDIFKLLKAIVAYDDMKVVISTSHPNKKILLERGRTLASVERRHIEVTDPDETGTQYLKG